jgi:HEAT repeat protein
MRLLKLPRFLGVILFAIERMIETSVRYFQRLYKMPAPNPLEVLKNPYSKTKQRQAALLTIRQERNKEATPILVRMLSKSPNRAMYNDLIHTLVQIGDPAAVDMLMENLRREDNTGLRITSARVLGVMGDKRAIPLLIHTLEHDRFYMVRSAAAEALGRLDDPAAINPLLAALKDTHGATHWSAARALGQLSLHYPEIVDPLIATLKDRKRSPHMGQIAITTLEKINSPLVINTLIEFLNEGTSRVPPRDDIETNSERVAYEYKRQDETSARGLAAAALGKFGDKRAVEPLKQRLKDPTEHPSLQPFVLKALEQLGEDPTTLKPDA